MHYRLYLRQGIRNALGVLLYVSLIALFISNSERLFSGVPDMPFGPIAMLLLFIISALTTGSLVLWQPLKLLADGKKSEAGTLLCITGASLVGILLILGVVLVVVY